jgi:hypothetical protein
MSKFFDNYNLATGSWRTDPCYQEILKLDRLLTGANIPHVTKPLHDGWQICYPDTYESKNCVMDAIQHYGSYGSLDDTVEIMGLLTPDEEAHDSVVGDLLAEEVFDRIRKHYSGEWDSYYYAMKDIYMADKYTEQPHTVESRLNTDPMTPEEFKNLMANAKSRYDEHDDEEETHVEMDGIMCNLLRQLGYGEGVDIFNSTPKWYA